MGGSKEVDIAAIATDVGLKDPKIRCRLCHGRSIAICLTQEEMDEVK